MRLRGYTLPLVILVLGTLATAMTLMVFVLGASAKTTGSMLGRRETLYACDGIVRGLMVKSRDYFAETPLPTAAGLRDHLCGPLTAPGCPPTAGWIPEFVVESVTATTGEFDKVEEVPTGPFRGQMARRTDIELTVVAKKVTTAQRCRVSQTAINSEIGLFQFAVFSAMPIELLQPPNMDIRGRVHVNGDFEAGGTNSLIIEKVTAAGRIFATTDGFKIRDATDDGPEPITSGNDGDSPGWRANSENTWHGNAQDVSWGVPFLRLPVATSAIVQGGKNANGTTVGNSGMLRVLVDPPRSDDDAATAEERLANKALIRIINGIWYKKDGANWPGIPIWSDHPAPYDSIVTQDLEERALVGSTTLAAAPTSGAGPKRYSLYETVAGVVANDPDPNKPSVISYGSLAVSGGTWVPGHLDAGNIVAAGVDAERLVDGTRSGFVDGRVEKGMANGVTNIDIRRGRVLPLNFNVDAFVEALQDTSPGELGSHFPLGLGDEAVVWIANTWPGWLSGFPNGAATKPPLQPNAELMDLLGTTPRLPLPLCGGSGALAGTVNKMACASSGMVAPTAVRVWNAQTIKPDVLPRGLTIVSNGPMYVLGDTNVGSLTAGVPGLARTEDPAGNWVPLMVGGDAVTLLSNKWSDQERRWSVASVAAKYPVANCTPADTVKTTFVLAVLGGHVERTSSNASGGVQNFPRFLECWNTVDAVIHGSLVAGYRSVYQDQGFSLGPYRPPNRLWKFDPNLAKPANQPPGTPSFFVSAVERWQRD